jgi:lysophospholipase L1-like esterase
MKTALKYFKRSVLVIAILIFGIFLLLNLISGVILSGILFTFSIYVLTLYLILKIISKFNWNKGFIISAYILLISLFGVEVWLRFIQKQNLNYTEINGGLIYISTYRLHNLWNTQYKPGNKPHSTYTEKKAEYSFALERNNLGFRGKDVIEKQANEYRILAMGDSWTEGVGAPQGYEWPTLLNKQLENAADGTVLFNVINVGKAGNDPIYNLKSLKDEFIHLQPNLVLLGLNGSDVEDIIARGGLERINKNGNIQLKKGPWWEFIYGYSYIFRQFIHAQGYNRMLMKGDERSIYTDAALKLAESVLEIHQFCQSKQVQFGVIIIPDQYEVINGHFFRYFDVTWKKLNAFGTIPIIFLPNLYNQQGLTWENAHQYYWKMDLHHNAKGYELMAKCVYQDLRRKFRFEAQ